MPPKKKSAPTKKAPKEKSKKSPKRGQPETSGEQREVHRKPYNK